MPMPNDPLQLASVIRGACVQAALDGYERAQIAGLCQKGAWECAVDAMRMIDLRTILSAPTAPMESPPASPGPASA
ncbi:MAG: hypothetical protein NTY05_14950 [Rhodocyclales bacterium]|nr:hypothetical protein [Rhodocyclales bacterium]